MKRMLVPVSILLALNSAALSRPEAEKTVKDVVQSISQAEDAPIQAYRLNLLDLAFAGVSEMPLNPHIKNRSRAQMKIVDAALELDQPNRAQRYLEQIENWQRWLGYAHLAAFYMKHQNPDRAAQVLAEPKAMLEMAGKVKSGEIVAVSENPLINTLTDWRYQRVESKVTEVEASMAAAQQESAMEPAMAALRTAAASQDFEIIHAALLDMVKLVDAHYESVQLPEWADTEFAAPFQRMPVFLKMDVLVALAETGVRHQDDQNARAIIERLEGLIETASLPLRLHIPEAARVVALRIKCGDTAIANQQMKLLLQQYEEERETIVDIERAALLCRIAELFGLSGDDDQALELYRRAVDEGCINPNARPRADDLGEICCSMALHDVAPSEALMRKLETMKNELGSPW